MIFHENRLLADDSHVISYQLGKMSQNVSSAAVVIGTLRVRLFHCPFSIMTLAVGVKLNINKTTTHSYVLLR